MSRIDKLVNRAFPDELRNVEPIAVDEDAIFAHTLEKLGLNAQSPLAEPKPLKQSQRGRREAKLVEVPQTEVKHRWVEWTGWAVAACLVIAFAVSWGPWLMSNLGFGTRDPGPAEKGPQTYSSSGPTALEGGGERQEISPTPFPPKHTPPPDFTPAPTALAGEPGEIDVADILIGDGGFTVDLRFWGMTVAEIGRFEMEAYNKSTGQILECSGRTNSSGKVEVSFLWDQKFVVGEATLKITRLIGDGSDKYDFEFVDSFLLELGTGKAARIAEDEADGAR